MLDQFVVGTAGWRMGEARLVEPHVSIPDAQWRPTRSRYHRRTRHAGISYYR